MKRLCDSHTGLERLARNTRANAKKQMLDESEVLRISLLEVNGVQEQSATSSSVLPENRETVNTISDFDKHSSITADELTTTNIGTISSLVRSDEQLKLGSSYGFLVKGTVSDVNRRENKNKATAGETHPIKKDSCAGKNKTGIAQQESNEKLIAPKAQGEILNKNSKTAFDVKHKVIESELNPIQLDMNASKTVNKLIGKLPIALIHQKILEKSSDNSTTQDACQSTNDRKLSAEPASKLSDSKLQHFKEDVNFLSGENKTHLQYFKKVIAPGLKKTGSPSIKIIDGNDSKKDSIPVSSNLTSKVVGIMKNAVVNKVLGKSIHSIAACGRDGKMAAGSDSASPKPESKDTVVKSANSALNDKVKDKCSSEDVCPIKLRLGSSGDVTTTVRNSREAGNPSNQLSDDRTVAMFENNCVRAAVIDRDDVQPIDPKVSEVALSNAVERSPVNSIKKIPTSTGSLSYSNDDTIIRQNVLRLKDDMILSKASDKSLPKVSDELILPGPRSKDDMTSSKVSDTVLSKVSEQLVLPINNKITPDALGQDSRKISFPLKDSKPPSGVGGSKKRSWISTFHGNEKSKTDMVRVDSMNVAISTDGEIKRNKADRYSQVKVTSEKVFSVNRSKIFPQSRVIHSSVPKDTLNKPSASSIELNVCPVKDALKPGTLASRETKDVLNLQSCVRSEHHSKDREDYSEKIWSDFQNKVRLCVSNVASDRYTKIGCDNTTTVDSEAQRKIVLNQHTRVFSNYRQTKFGLDNKMSDFPGKVALHRQTNVGSGHQIKVGSDIKVGSNNMNTVTTETRNKVVAKQHIKVGFHQPTEVNSDNKDCSVSSIPASKVVVNHQTKGNSDHHTKVDSDNKIFSVATMPQGKVVLNQQTKVRSDHQITEVGLSNQSKAGSIDQIKVGLDHQPKAVTTFKTKAVSDNCSKVVPECHDKMKSISSLIQLNQSKVDSDHNTDNNPNLNLDDGMIQSSRFKRQVCSANYLGKLQFETKSVKSKCKAKDEESINEKIVVGDVPTLFESIYAMKEADKATFASIDQGKHDELNASLVGTPNKVESVSNTRAAQVNNSDPPECKSIQFKDISKSMRSVKATDAEFEENAILSVSDKCNQLNPVILSDEETLVPIDLNRSLKCDVQEKSSAMKIHKERNLDKFDLIKQSNFINLDSIGNKTQDISFNEDVTSIVIVNNQHQEKKKDAIGFPSSTPHKIGRRGFRNKPVGQINMDKSLLSPTVAESESVTGGLVSRSSMSTDENSSMQSFADQVSVEKSSTFTDSITLMTKCSDSTSVILESVEPMQMSTMPFTEKLTSCAEFSINELLSHSKERNNDFVLGSSNLSTPESSEIIPICDSVDSVKNSIKTGISADDSVETCEFRSTADLTHSDGQIDSIVDTASVSKLKNISSVYVSQSMIKIINESQLNSSTFLQDQDLNNEIDELNNIDTATSALSQTASPVAKCRRSIRIKNVFVEKSIRQKKDTEQRNLIEDFVESFPLVQGNTGPGRVRKRSRDFVKKLRDFTHSCSDGMSKSISNAPLDITGLFGNASNANAQNSTVDLCENVVECFSKLNHASQAKQGVKTQQLPLKSKKNAKCALSFEQNTDSEKSSRLEICEKSGKEPELVFDESQYTLFSEVGEIAVPAKSLKGSRKRLSDTNHTTNDLEVLISLDSNAKKPRKSRHKNVEAFVDFSNTSPTGIKNQCADDSSLKAIIDLPLKKAKVSEKIDFLEETKITSIKSKSDEKTGKTKRRNECTKTLKLMNDRSVTKRLKVNTATKRSNKTASSKQTKKAENAEAMNSLIASGSNFDVNQNPKIRKNRVNAKKTNLKRNKIELCTTSQQRQVKEQNSVGQHENTFLKSEEVVTKTICLPERLNNDQSHCAPLTKTSRRRSRTVDQRKKSTSTDNEKFGINLNSWKELQPKSTESDDLVSKSSKILKVPLTFGIDVQQIPICTQGLLVSERFKNSELPLLNNINLTSSDSADAPCLNEIDDKNLSNEIVDRNLSNSDKNLNLMLRMMENSSDLSVASEERSEHHKLLLEIPATRINPATMEPTSSVNLVLQILTNPSQQSSLNQVAECVPLVFGIPAKVLNKFPSDDTDKGTPPLVFQLQAKGLDSGTVNTMHQNIQLLIEMPARIIDKRDSEIRAMSLHDAVNVHSNEENAFVQGSTSADNEECSCAPLGSNIPSSFSSLNGLPSRSVSVKNAQRKKESSISSKNNDFSIIDNSTNNNEENQVIEES